MIAAIVPQFFSSDLKKTLAYFDDQLGFETQFEYGDPTFYAGALRDGHSIVPPADMRQLAQSADDPRAEAIFIGCTGQRLAPLIDSMESQLGKPVLTANQVTSWHGLLLLGVRPQLRGRGRLFSDSSGAETQEA